MTIIERKEVMIIFADYAPLEECQNDDVIELCRQCNRCDRFTEKKENVTEEVADETDTI